VSAATLIRGRNADTACARSASSWHVSDYTDAPLRQTHKRAGRKSHRMSEQCPCVLLVSIHVGKKTLSEPSLGVVRVHDLSLQETLVGQFAIVELEIEVAEVDPHIGVLGVSLRLPRDPGNLLTLA